MTLQLDTVVKHTVECLRVQTDAPFLHFLVRAEDLLDTLGHGEVFEIGAVSHGVDAGTRLLRVRMAVDQLQSFLFLRRKSRARAGATPASDTFRVQRRHSPLRAGATPASDTFRV